MSINRPCFAISVGLLGGLAWTGSALAGGFATARFGGEHGNPITSNPTAVYYNPAGLAEGEGIHLFLDGNIALRAASYAHSAAATDDVTVPKANTGRRPCSTWLPRRCSARRPGSATWRWAPASMCPSAAPRPGTRTRAFEGNRELAGPVDGVQRWHSIESSLQAMFFTLAAAYKIPSLRLSLGVSGNLIRTQVNTVRARNASGDNLLATEGRSLLEVSGFHASFGVGALVEAVPKQLWIGASYQSRPNVTGESRSRARSPTASAACRAPRATWSCTRACRTSCGSAPASSRRSASRCGSSATGRGGARWKTSASPRSARRARSTATASPERGPAWCRTSPAAGTTRSACAWAGATGRGLRSSSSAASGTTPTQFLTRPWIHRRVDFHDVSFSLGGRFHVAKQLHLAASYTQLFYVDRDTTGDSITAGLHPNSRAPDSGGHYTQKIGVLNLNVDVAF